MTGERPRKETTTLLLYCTVQYTLLREDITLHTGQVRFVPFSNVSTISHQLVSLKITTFQGLPPGSKEGDDDLSTICLAERTVCDPLALPSSTSNSAPPGATKLHITAVAAALCAHKSNKNRNHECLVSRKGCQGRNTP